MSRSVVINKFQLQRYYRHVPGEVLPIMAYTWRLCPKGVPFSGFRYIKG